MTAGVVGVLAEALAQHQPRYGGADSTACSHPDCEGVEWEPAHVASVVAALPNIAIVKLPEMVGTGEWPCGFGDVEASLDGKVLWPTVIGKMERKPDAAVQFAAALLAAARAAGGQSCL